MNLKPPHLAGLWASDFDPHSDTRLPETRAGEEGRHGEIKFNQALAFARSDANPGVSQAPGGHISIKLH